MAEPPPFHPPPFPWLYPYVEEPVSRDYPPDKDVVLRPVVEVWVTGPEGTEKVAALVDTGAEDTIVSRGLCRVVGIEPSPNRETTLGIGGAYRTCYFADVTLRLAPSGQEVENAIAWITEAAVPASWEPPWQVVLGQIGFFDQFTVSVSRLSQALAVERSHAFDDQYGLIIGLAPDETPPPP
jgi:Aspartyl protease